MCNSEWEELTLSETKRLDFSSTEFEVKEYRFQVNDSCSAITIDLQQYSSEMFIAYIFQAENFWMHGLPAVNDKVYPNAITNPLYICPGEFGYAPGTWVLYYVYASTTTGYPFAVDTNLTVSTLELPSVATPVNVLQYRI